MAWQNAPVLQKLASSPLIGKNGAQIWGVDTRGRLYTNYQILPGGGTWDGWMTNSWSFGGYPEMVYELCASQMLEGQAQLWVLDYKRQLWSLWQDKQGNWQPWQGNWNKPPGNVVFKKIAALYEGPMQGARVWAITEDGILTSCKQTVPQGNWGGWSDWPKPQDHAGWVEVSACMQGDGKGALWGIDAKQQLWGMVQESPGGKWGAWVGPNWEQAPRLRNIAAVETMVKKNNDTIHGACIWGITAKDGTPMFNEQSRPSANWFGWSEGSFKNTLKGYEITACRQNNQSARVWVVSNEQILVSQQVTLNSSPPGWERFWTPDL